MQNPANIAFVTRRTTRERYIKTIEYRYLSAEFSDSIYSQFIQNIRTFKQFEVVTMTAHETYILKLNNGRKVNILRFLCT